MRDYILMKIRKNGVKVRVYDISITAEGKGSYATVWNEAEKNWQTMKINQLVPDDTYLACEDQSGCKSKTERNRIKDQLTLQEAIWVCTDGKKFYYNKDSKSDGVDEAIRHEKELMEKE